MRVSHPYDLPDGRMRTYTYADLDEGRVPDNAVYYVQEWEGRRYKAGGVLAVMCE